MKTTHKVLLAALASLAAWAAYPLWLDRPPDLTASRERPPAQTEAASAAAGYETISGGQDRPAAGAPVEDWPLPHRLHADESPTVPVFELSEWGDVQGVLDTMGIDRDYDGWLRERGLDFDAGLMQTYNTLSNEELRRLADHQDDQAAALLLGTRLTHSSPLEAHDRFRRLVDEGMIGAMRGLASNLEAAYGALDAGISRWEWSLETRTALLEMRHAGIDPAVEITAWNLLAETYEGQPRGARFTQYENSGGRITPRETIALACDRAVELRAELEAIWQGSNSGWPGNAANPFVDVDPALPNRYAEACPTTKLSAADFSACRPFDIPAQGKTIRLFVCDEAREAHMIARSPSQARCWGPNADLPTP